MKTPKNKPKVTSNRLVSIELVRASVGARIYFVEEKAPYRVRSRSERYLVCTKPFNLLKTVIYTVVDLHELVRGTENLVLGFGAESDDDCNEMIARLEGSDPYAGMQSEVSHRNRIPLRVARVLCPNAKAEQRRTGDIA